MAASAEGSSPRDPVRVALEFGRVNASKQWWPPTQRQRVWFGILFVALGALQLVLVEGLGGHVLNLVVGIGWLTLGCLYLARAAMQARRERANPGQYRDRPIPRLPDRGATD